MVQVHETDNQQLSDNQNHVKNFDSTFERDRVGVEATVDTLQIIDINLVIVAESGHLLIIIKTSLAALMIMHFFPLMAWELLVIVATVTPT